MNLHDTEPPNGSKHSAIRSWRVRVRLWGSVVNAWYRRALHLASQAVRRAPMVGWKRPLLGVVALMTPLAAFTTVFDGVADRTLDGCRKIRVCDPLPPPVLVGTLTEVRVGASGLTLQEAYAERALPTPPTLTQRDGPGSWPGQLITYRVEFQGLEEALCSVKWTLYDAQTGRRIPERDSSTWQTVHVPAFSDGGWVVEANESDVNIGLIWVPYVKPGTFIVEVELLDPRGYHLDIERTPPFEVTIADVPAG